MQPTFEERSIAWQKARRQYIKDHEQKIVKVQLNVYVPLAIRDEIAEMVAQQRHKYEDEFKEANRLESAKTFEKENPCPSVLD